MRNPLDSFKEHMLNYNLVRNNNLITTVKGLPNTEKGTNRKFIALYPEIDIQINDILINVLNKELKKYIQIICKNKKCEVPSSCTRFFLEEGKNC